MVPAEDATIYVYLLDEGIDVWRPVRALHLGADLYRITSDSSAPEFKTEQWQFSTGDVVRCVLREFYEGTGLVAIELLQSLGDK